MTRRPHVAAFVTAALAAAPALAVDDAPAPSMQVAPPSLSAVWDDPSFQRSFVGGYGISPDVEPRVSPDDLALLELVRQLMPDDLPAAEALLKGSIGQDTSAVLDLSGLTGRIRVKCVYSDATNTSLIVLVTD